jgi:imidazolonepropionase-like amidohydrolase
VIDVSGKTIIPGIINAHGHVGDVKGIEPGHYSAENIQDQLELYARYGVTTVVSLGDDRSEAEPFRAAIDTSASPGRARLYIAGTVVSGTTPEDAVAMVDENMRMGVDFMKIRVDDNLGSGTKMSEEVYRAVIDRSHEHGIRLAAHMYYLEDAKALLRSGADFIAHSVRDVAVDSSLIRLLKERNVCYCPTLTRDLSTFVYGEIPDFFEDPFFLREVDTAILQPLKDPQRRLQVRQSRSAQTYKQGLQWALKNLKTLSDSGVVIAFGTDSGVSGRFQGYFEHLEMELMAEAGLSPMEILTSATGSAASCLDLKDVGTLEPGKLADFVVLDKDPVADITNTRGISSVWIGGKSVSDNW